MHEIKLSDHTAPLSFIQITDTHLLDNPAETMHGVNTRDSFEAVLLDALRCYPDIDFLLFTGDISQTGGKQSYRQFQSVIEQCDKPVYCVPGNHDTPEFLRQVVSASPKDSIETIRLGSIYLILLSSHVEGRHHGAVTQKQLQQLENFIASSRAPLHIIALHHPPALIDSHWLDELGLVNRSEVLDVISSCNHNSLLLSGHVHQEVDQQLANVRLLATPSTCYQFVARSATMQREEAPRPAYRYVRLNTNRQIQTEVHTIEWSADDNETSWIQTL
jgi:Icc protein